MKLWSASGATILTAYGVQRICVVYYVVSRLYVQAINSCWQKYSERTPGKWTVPVFSALLLTSHFWNICECCRRTGTSEMLHPWLYIWKCGKRRRKEDLWLQPWGCILGSCSAELIPLRFWQPGSTTLLSFYLPAPDLCKVPSDNPGLIYDPTFNV